MSPLGSPNRAWKGAVLDPLRIVVVDVAIREGPKRNGGHRQRKAVTARKEVAFLTSSRLYSN